MSFRSGGAVGGRTFLDMPVLLVIAGGAHGAPRLVNLRYRQSTLKASIAARIGQDARHLPDRYF